MRKECWIKFDVIDERWNRPWKVLRLSHSCSICLLLTINHHCIHSVFHRKGCLTFRNQVSSKKIIDIEILYQTFNSFILCNTFLSTIIRHKVIEIVNAATLFVVVKHRLWNQSHSSHGLWDTWWIIILPICGSITNHCTFQIIRSRSLFRLV